jgi:predicted RNA-binding Zn ribbon-like protein
VLQNALPSRNRSRCYTETVGTPEPRYREHRFDTGAAWLDLLATRGHAYGGEPIERLNDLPALRAWLDHERLIPVAPVAEADVARVRALRETLRPLVLAVLDGDEPADVALLQPWLDADEPVCAVVRDGRPAAAPPSTLDAALARLARQAVEQLPDAALAACADPDCRMAYIDPTGRRRWCSPQRCGVKARVRAHRARARGAGSDEAPE